MVLVGPGHLPVRLLWSTAFMKRFSVIAAAALALLGTSAVHARSLETIQKDGTIRVATEGYYAPFAYFEGKQLTGFEVDLAELLV